MKGREIPPGDLASRRGGIEWPGFDIGAKLLSAYAAHLDALLDIQARTIGTGITAFRTHQAELFSAIANRPLVPSWLQFREESAATWAGLATSWFYQMAKAQAMMLEAVGQALSDQYRPPHWPPPVWAGIAQERRQRSAVIKFPDRRRTTGYASGQR